MALPDELRALLARAKDAPHLSWRALLKPGDWLVLVAMAVVVVVSYPLFWRGGQATRAIVKRDGLVVLDVALNAPRMLQVQGALGVSVIEIQPGRARVRADPGPRQQGAQLVRQGHALAPHSIRLRWRTNTCTDARKCAARRSARNTERC